MRLVVGTCKKCKGGNFSVVFTVIHKDLKKAVKVTVEHSDLVSHGTEGGAVNESVGKGLCRYRSCGDLG